MPQAWPERQPIQAEMLPLLTAALANKVKAILRAMKPHPPPVDGS